MTMNESNIIDSIMKKTGFDKKDTKAFLNAFIDTTKATVKKHSILRLVGILTIKVAHRKARKFRNPQTGKPGMTDAKDVPVIKAGSILRKLANE